MTINQSLTYPNWLNNVLNVQKFPISKLTPVMFEAYRHIVSDTNQARRSYMLDLLESVRHDYVHGGYT